MKRTPYLKNIYKRGNTYYVIKSIHGKKQYYGSFKTLDEARKHRDKVKANNWKQVPLTDEQQLEKEVEEYYMNIGLDTYGTQYRIHGYNAYYGMTNTIETALYYRDLVKQGITKKPYELDLITDNPYIRDGLKYPLPERLIKPERNTSYGQGSITKKGPTSFHVHHGSRKNGKHSFVYACPTYEMAEYVRRKMVECNWNKDKLDEIVENYPEYYTYLLYFYQYITKNNRTGKFLVTLPKEVTGGRLEYIRYNRVEDALFERDFLKEHDWDYDLLVETINDSDNPYYDMELPPYPTRRVKRVKERDFHEEELTYIIQLLKEGYSQDEICNQMELSAVTLRNWLKNGYNSSWREFVKLVEDDVNPLEVLEKQEIIYQPDLSRSKPSNFNNYVSRKLDEYGLRFIVSRKGVYYGCYPSEKLAHKISKDLSKVDWDKSKLVDIQAKNGFKSIVNSRRWVYPNGKGWAVRRKNKDKRMVTYGTWHDKRIAEIVRDMLIVYGWNLDNMLWIEEVAVWTVHCMDLYNNGLFGGVSLEDLQYVELCEEESRYCYPCGKYYQVRKRIGNRNVSFGKYKTRENAMHVVEFLEDNNWNKELLKVMHEMGEI